MKLLTVLDLKDRCTTIKPRAVCLQQLASSLSVDVTCASFHEAALKQLCY
jgi:hypothetical protein